MSKWPCCWNVAVTSQGDSFEGDGTVIFRASESSVILLSNIKYYFNLIFRTKTQIVEPLFLVGALGLPGYNSCVGRGQRWGESCPLRLMGAGTCALTASATGLAPLGAQEHPQVQNLNCSL